MPDAADRLKEARLRAGYDEIVKAARALKLHPQNWADHEARRRKIQEKHARVYAKKLNVDWVWLLTGQEITDRRKVPLKGYVGAGAQVHAIGAQDIDFIEAPPGADDDDIAFEIRGGSMPPFRNGGYVLARPVSDISDVLGRLAVVDLEDGSRWFKQVMPSAMPGRHTLVSLQPGAEPMLDVRIVAVAKFHIYVDPD